MEEKKKRLSWDSTLILTIFFTALIIVAIGVTYFINNLYNKQQQQVNELKEELNEVKSNIQNEENVTNVNSTNLQNNNNNQTTNNIKEVKNITGVGYIAKLYSNNELKVTIEEDIEAIVGEITDNIKNKTFSVTGITGNIKNIYSGNVGTGVEPALLCVLEDGTVEYVAIFTQLRDNVTSLKTDGKINGLANVVEIKEANDGDGMIAVQSDGTELKFWNRPENVE